MMMQQKLVLIPGMLNNAALWNAVAPALREKVQVVTPTSLAQDSVTAMADAVLAYTPPGPFALAGFSMGGWVAQEVVRRAGDRVNRLALISSSAGPANASERDMLARAGTAAATGFDVILERMLPMVMHASHLGDHALREAAIRMWRDVGPTIYVRQCRAAMDRPDLRAVLHDLQIPVLIACGSEDQVTPPALARELAGLIPSAHLAFVDRCGHLLPLERPDELVALLWQWLDA
jgi:pimeloyl-ACP methyl ester carboxylesterase